MNYDLPFDIFDNSFKWKIIDKYDRFCSNLRGFLRGMFSHFGLFTI